MTTERTIVFSTKHQVTMTDPVTPDIDKDPVFMDLYQQVMPYTMTSKEAVFALYTSINYVLDRNIPGDIVECGVWRGGSSLLAALIMKTRNIRDRKLYLYDTFQGMPTPTEFSIQLVLYLGGLSTTPQRAIETASSSVQMTLVVSMGGRTSKALYMSLIRAHVALAA